MTLPDPALQREVDARLDALTLDEQVALLSGQDFWRTTEIPHKVPSIKTTDGPAGARGENFSSGTKAALFPSAVSLAATWDEDVLAEVGAAIAQEAKTKGASVLLAPTACNHRSPLGGRNFESFSEDPFLSGKLAAAYIRGAQSQNVAVTMKHFVANEQETHRFSVNEIIDERTLREIYLKPFEIAVREAEPWGIMTSYNKLNGQHADSNLFTLNEVLRKEWAYDGLVMSDWGGTNSTVDAVKAGLDLEMPGPARQRGEKLLKAARSTNDPELLASIRIAARHVLELVARTGQWDNFSEAPEKAEDRPEHRELIRRAGREGIVLLRNENVAVPNSSQGSGAWTAPLHKPVLPLDSSIKKIAWIGPNANTSRVGGGGSASLNPHYLTNPYDAIKEAVGPDVQVDYAPGCQTEKWVKLLPVDEGLCRTQPDAGEPGLLAEFFAGRKCAGEPVETRVLNTSNVFLMDGKPEALGGQDYSVRLTTYVHATLSGSYLVGIGSIGPATLYIDDDLLIDNTAWTHPGELFFVSGSPERTATVTAEAGRWYKFTCETTTKSKATSPADPYANTNMEYNAVIGVRLGVDVVISQSRLIAEAADLAAAADVAIIVAGNTPEWESEGYDRTTMLLPGRQNDLIRAVAGKQKRTVVVLQSGCALELPWLSQVPTVLQAWYQGQEAGNALADVLTGRTDAGGRLSISWPARIFDNPSYGHFGEPDAVGPRAEEVHYSEGLYVGYRHYDTHHIPVLFPFGAGLSYTTFTVGRVTASSDVLAPNGKALAVAVSIRNVGDRPGSTVLQLYLHQRRTAVDRPRRELKTWKKVRLQPGEEQTVELHIGQRDPGFWDEERKKWRVASGRYQALIGTSTADIRGKINFKVKEEWEWVF